MDVGFTAGLRAYADSSAAIGICRRAGVGSVRHVAVGQLWAQERVRPGDFELIKWLGAENSADVLTKAVNGQTIGKHMSSLGVNWEDGRAVTAPLIDEFSWESRGFLASPSHEHQAPPECDGGVEADAHPPLHEDGAAAHGRGLTAHSA
eukprot:3866217-Alexandrium_andersonii.AAC.1